MVQYRTGNYSVLCKLLIWGNDALYRSSIVLKRAVTSRNFLGTTTEQGVAIFFIRILALVDRPTEVGGFRAGS